MQFWDFCSISKEGNLQNLSLFKIKNKDVSSLLLRLRFKGYRCASNKSLNGGSREITFFPFSISITLKLQIYDIAIHFCNKFCNKFCKTFFFRYLCNSFCTVFCNSRGLAISLIHLLLFLYIHLMNIKNNVLSLQASYAIKIVAFFLIND